ncbi:MAG: hypothetical protein V7641_5030 [Blastocatellia bacterium]
MTLPLLIRYEPFVLCPCDECLDFTPGESYEMVM